MKSNLLFIALLFLGTVLSAQIFTEVQESDLINSTHGTVIFGDVNGDGAPDALFSGYDFFDSPAEITLYINDGAGNFTEKANTPIKGIRSGSMAFADVDGNQTQDLLISGGNYWNNGGVIYITKLYLNGGSGDFTEKSIPGLNSIQGNFAFADVDGNNTQDVIISDFSETRLYLNDGNGNFTEKPDTASVFITSGDLAFADIDGNSTQDLIISGNDSLGLATYIYLNDGAGNFSIKSGMQNIGSSGGSITFADVDGDSTQDMLLSGIIFTTQVEKITRLYLNDGSGNFTEKTGTNFNTVSDGSVNFLDVDGNNTLDLLITGNKAPTGAPPFQPVTALYLNDGSGNFTEKTGSGFVNLHRSSVAVADIDGNSSPDVIMSGTEGAVFPAANVHQSMVYFNDGMGEFAQKPNASFTGILDGKVVFKDMNGDSTPDLLVSGPGDTSSIVKLYLNNKKSAFVENPNTQIEGLSFGSMAVADVNGDIYPDVLISGFNDLGVPFPFTRLYTNDSSGVMTQVLLGYFPGVSSGEIALVDVNEDNQADVLLTGESFSGPIARLYMNQGNLSFSENTNIPFEAVKNSSIAFADVDGDSTKDILITGNTGSENIAKLYLNDGSGSFTEKPGTPFEGVSNGSIAFADVDGNQTQDVVITGETASGSIARLYLNDGMGNFTEQTGTPFEGISNSSIAFADADGNQAIDLLLTGNTGLERITKLYLNDGSGSFYEHTETPFEEITNGTVTFADADGDHTQDVLITGQDSLFNKVVKLYLNDGSMFTSNDREVVETGALFTLYPNPVVAGEVFLDLSSLTQSPTMVRIMDLHGRIVVLQQISEKTNQQTIRLDISYLHPGYFIVQVSDGKKIISRKLVIR